MSTYVISDIHGMYDMWKHMMEKIKLTDDDRLIVIGDVIDRGSDGVKILQEIMDNKNITMLIGNHELMMLENWFNPDDSEIADNWMYNGGYPTVQAMMRLSAEEQDKIIQFLRNCVIEAHVSTDDGRRFHLVHGWLSPVNEKENHGEYIYNSVWGRPGIRTAKCKSAEGTLIIGHTPVMNLYDLDECKDFSRNHFRIMHAPNFINIDCGCGHKADGDCLSCLRLDDMKEFYVLQEGMD